MTYLAPDGKDAAWILAVLKALGTAPNDYNNVALSLWAQSEGMPDYANNWLATERNGYGGTTYNAAGVFAYPSFSAGVKATADTIRQSNMNDIYVALREARSLSFIFDAINRSPWCGGCQGGKYPVALFDYISGLVGGASITPGGIGRPVQEPTTAPAFDWSATVRESGKYMTRKAGSVSGYSQAIRHLP